MWQTRELPQSSPGRSFTARFEMLDVRFRSPEWPLLHVYPLGGRPRYRVHMCLDVFRPRAKILQSKEPRIMINSVPHDRGAVGTVYFVHIVTWVSNVECLFSVFFSFSALRIVPSPVWAKRKKTKRTLVRQKKKRKRETLTQAQGSGRVGGGP